MKSFIFLAMTLLIGLMVGVDAAMAQVNHEQAAELLKPVLEMLFGFLPESVVGILALVGGLRVLFKPLMALLEAVAIYTPSKKDDEIYREVVEGNTYKTIRFIVDFVASIKLPQKKK